MREKIIRRLRTIVILLCIVFVFMGIAEFAIEHISLGLLFAIAIPIILIGGLSIANAFFAKDDDNRTHEIQDDIFRQINSLADLKEKGVLSETEFEEKKKNLLKMI